MCVGLVHKALLSQRCKTDQTRRANRLAAAGSEGAAGDEAESGSGPSITHKVRVLQELTRYVAEGAELV